MPEYLLDPSPHGAIAYGPDAATALADPRLLPTLHTLEQRLGDHPDLRQAMLALVYCSSTFGCGRCRAGGVRG